MNNALLILSADLLVFEVCCRLLPYCKTADTISQVRSLIKGWGAICLFMCLAVAVSNP